LNLAVKDLPRRCPARSASACDQHLDRRPLSQETDETLGGWGIHRALVIVYNEPSVVGPPLHVFSEQLREDLDVVLRLACGPEAIPHPLPGTRHYPGSRLGDTYCKCGDICGGWLSQVPSITPPRLVKPLAGERGFAVPGWRHEQSNPS
jgi:hypothetical protein